MAELSEEQARMAGSLKWMKVTLAPIGCGASAGAALRAKPLSSDSINAVVVSFLKSFQTALKPFYKG